jgi:hypothetical protein
MHNFPLSRPANPSFQPRQKMCFLISPRRIILTNNNHNWWCAILFIGCPFLSHTHTPPNNDQFRERNAHFAAAPLPLYTDSLGWRPDKAMRIGSTRAKCKRKSIIFFSVFCFCLAKWKRKCNNMRTALQQQQRHVGSILWHRSTRCVCVCTCASFPWTFGNCWVTLTSWKWD